MTESLFAAGGYSTPTANAPYLPVTPLGLVAKNFHAAAASAAFSQVSVQSTPITTNQYENAIEQFALRKCKRDTKYIDSPLHSVELF